MKIRWIYDEILDILLGIVFVIVAIPFFLFLFIFEWSSWWIEREDKE